MLGQHKLTNRFCFTLLYFILCNLLQTNPPPYDKHTPTEQGQQQILLQLFLLCQYEDTALVGTNGLFFCMSSKLISGCSGNAQHHDAYIFLFAWSGFWKGIHGRRITSAFQEKSKPENMSMPGVAFPSIWWSRKYTAALFGHICWGSWRSKIRQCGATC